MERFRMELESLSKNEEFARVVVAVFLSRLDPTLEEIDDVKTAVSEAVTNAEIHGYGGEKGAITVEVETEGKELTVVVEDYGVGIRDVEKRERLTKRCRRCIKIFNNDDFYYFFANIEEETSPLFALFASPSFCVCLSYSSQSYRVITNHNPLQCSLYPVSITHRRGDYREIQRGVSLQAIVWFLHKVTFVRP